jgi:hypothetical protein
MKKKFTRDPLKHNARPPRIINSSDTQTTTARGVSLEQLELEEACRARHESLRYSDYDSNSNYPGYDGL